MRLLSKAFSFQGRDTRADFLIYIGTSILFAVVGALAILGLADASEFGAWDDGPGLGPLAMTVLGLLVLAVAVIRFLSTCRRLRDTDSSPWLALLLFVPAIGGLVTLALMFIRSAPDRLTEDMVKVF